MTQIILLILIALVGKGCATSSAARNVNLEMEAEKFCCGHGGIDAFIYGDEEFTLLCKDGTKASGPIRAVRFFPTCREK